MAVEPTALGGWTFFVGGHAAAPSGSLPHDRPRRYDGSAAVPRATAPLRVCDGPDSRAYWSPLRRPSLPSARMGAPRHGGAVSPCTAHSCRSGDSIRCALGAQGPSVSHNRGSPRVTQSCEPTPEFHPGSRLTQPERRGFTGTGPSSFRALFRPTGLELVR